MQIPCCYKYVETELGRDNNKKNNCKTLNSKRTAKPLHMKTKNIRREQKKTTLLIRRLQAAPCSHISKLSA